MTNTTAIPPDRVALGLRLAVFEGIAYAATVGLGETFFLAHAIRLSATRLEQGLVATLPLFVGSIGALLAVMALARLSSRRRWVAGACYAQALVLGALALGSWTGQMTTELLIVAVAAYGLCGQAAGTAWSSWIGDLVPVAVRGRYFSRRNRWIYGTTFAGLALGGLLLEWLEPGGPASVAAAGTRSVGFATLYALAATARLISSTLHLRTPEPRFGGLTPRSRAFAYLKTRNGSSILRLLRVSGTFYFAVYLASPYFAPYMLEELQFGYAEYTAATATIVFAKIAVLPLHGRWIDRGHLRLVYVGCALAISLVPLPFLVARGLGLVMVAQAVSGIAWGGFEVAQFSLLLDRTSRRVRPHVFALQTALNGAAQLAGGLAGALLLSSRVSLSIAGLFLVSAAARALVALGLGAVSRPATGRRAPSPDTAGGRRPLLLRVVGLRPSGGLVVRVLPASRRPAAPPLAPAGPSASATDRPGTQDPADPGETSSIEA